jgi:tetratricopeptide (TPR) repeat protein
MNWDEPMMSDNDDDNRTTESEGETTASEDSEADSVNEIQHAREALASTPLDHPDRAERAASLGEHLWIRYNHTGDISLINEAIELDREVLALQPPGHPDRSTSCFNLGTSLHSCYEQTGNVALLNEAIELKREALALRPPGHPDRARSCTNLGSSLHACYEQTGNAALLDEAIELQREALALRPPGHPDRAWSCANLGSSRRVRFQQTGVVALLDEAIELEREALALRPPGHPDRANSCANLGASLHVRYKQTGDVALLDEAIELEREVLALQPPGHPDRAWSCANLGSSLLVRYKQTSDVALLDEAIELEREALALRPPGHPARADSCANFGSSLHARYQQTGDVALLDEAIELERDALALRPQGHPDRAHSCTNLGFSLRVRYEQTGGVALLDEAIEAYIYASEHSSASRVWYPLVFLSQLHLLRDSPHYSVSKALEYLQQSFQHEVDNIHTFISEVCYNFARMWDDSGVSNPHVTALLVDVYAKMVDRLPLVAGFVLDTSSRLRSLKLTCQIGSDAFVAAVLADRPATAVTLIDRAHGVVWSQALHQRDPQMEGAPASLSTELEGLLSAIATRTPVDPAGLLDQHDTQDLRYRQNTRIQAILRQIRAMPGLSHFMLGSTYEALREVARDHPVVVLVAARGHAFALIMSGAEESEPHALSLTLTSDELLSLRGSAEQAGLRSRADTRDGHTDARMRVQISKMNVNHQPLRVLAGIWRKIVKPVIEYLGLEVCSDRSIDSLYLTLFKQKATGRSRPRLHWCANGDFVFLPIHAAGIYTGPQASQACCSDFVVSSYTPTISALLRAQKSAAPIRSADVGMLLVGEDCATNLNMGKLWNVRKELTCVESIATTKQFGHTVESIPSAATVERVTERIKPAHFVHLACHGIQDPTKALESGFYLRDGMLTISKLMDLRLDQPWFAYLSACETAKGDAEQPDQVMHLAAAMLFAGFKSVVATMWSV